MKDYKKTREEIEDFVNKTLLPKIKEDYVDLAENGDKKAKDIVNRASIIMFLYSVNRMSAIESLIRLVTLYTYGTDNNPKINEMFM